MLETALIASPLDHKITTLKLTQNPSIVMRKPSRGVWYRQQLFAGIEKFPEKAWQQFSQ